MWTTLKLFLTTNAVKLAGYLLAGISIAGVLLGARKAGKDAVRAEVMETTLKAKNAQQNAAANAPRTRDGVVDELRKGDF